MELIQKRVVNEVSFMVAASVVDENTTLNGLLHVKRGWMGTGTSERFFRINWYAGLRAFVRLVKTLDATQEEESAENGVFFAQSISYPFTNDEPTVAKTTIL